MIAQNRDHKKLCTQIITTFEGIGWWNHKNSFTTNSQISFTLLSFYFL